MSKMQIEQPSEGQTIIPVAWYFAPDGAKTFYGVNAFSSGRWDPSLPGVPPQLGEQPPYRFPKWSGANLWGYTGQCRVGTDDQFANGLTAADLAAPLAPIPTCCATPRIGQTWFLRADRHASQSLVPGVFLPGWSNSNQHTVAGLLSDTPGQVVQTSPFMATFGPIVGEDTAAIQYLSDPLPAQTIPHQMWTIRVGEQALGSPFVEAIAEFQLWLIDGTTGFPKQLIKGLQQFGAVYTPSGGPNGGGLDFNVFPPTDVAFGDYLCLELGWHYSAFHGFLHNTLSAEIRDSGTMPIPNGINDNSSPMAILGYPPGGGDNDMPIPGTIIPFAGAGLPFGYLPCDGTLRNAADFPALFAAIGTLWGVGAPGTFALPDLRDRTVIGTSPGALSPTRPSVRAVGDVAGEETHTDTIPEMPSHGHTLVDPTHQHGFPAGVNVFTDAPFGPGTTPSIVAPMTLEPNTDFAATGMTMMPEGGGLGHNNMQPFAVVTWLIKW